MVASGNDESPVITTEPPTAVQNLNTDGSTSTVTMVAQDPEGFDITYGIAYKTANNARPAQLSADTTINQSTGVFTFTPTTNSSNAGSFRARLSASDGARITTRFVDFSIAFFPQRSNVIGWYQANDTNSYSGSGTSWTDISGHSTTGPTLNFWQGAPTYTSSNFISLTNAKSIDLMPNHGANQRLRNAAKTWMVVMKPPSGFGNFVVFHDGQSSNNYTGVFSSGASTNFYAGYSAYSGVTLNNRVNGTDVANNRGTAYSALTLGSWNSIIQAGLNFGSNTYNGLYYNNYNSFTQAHEVAYIIFWDVVLTTAEMQTAHDFVRGALGTSNMAAWSP